MLPLWAQILVALLPSVPQSAEEIASIFAPHAGTTTGQKISDTLGVLQSLASGVGQFQAQHQAAQQQGSSVAGGQPTS